MQHRWHASVMKYSARYKSTESANRGESLGGSGFLIGVPSDRHEGQSHCYAVTNLHVISQGYTVIRLTTAAGETEVLKLNDEDWLPHPNMDDVPVCPLARPQQRCLRWSPHPHS
jgi:hypothetical protein